MIKYSVYRDNIEFHSLTSRTSEEIFDAYIKLAYIELTDTNPDLIGSFTTLEEACKLFEKEKQSLRTSNIRADVLYIQEEHCDKDGEFLWANGIWDSAAEPYFNSIEEEEDFEPEIGE